MGQIGACDGRQTGDSGDVRHWQRCEPAHDASTIGSMTGPAGAPATTTNPEVSRLARPLALRPTITPDASRNRKSSRSPLTTGAPCQTAGRLFWNTAATFAPAATTAATSI